MKRTHILRILLLAIAATACRTEKKEITLDTLLDEMISYEENARYPAVPYTCRQESSYDRRSVSPDSAFWFANNDGFGIIRTDTLNGRRENVLFDQTGPGVITRFWLTTMDKRGTMRFYFDGSSQAQWEIPAYDLMQTGLPLGRGLLQPHTSYTPDGKGGNTLFLPIPYAKGCKITFELPDGVEPTPKYYGINFRKYPSGTPVKTFSPEEVTRLRDKIEQTNTLLLSPPDYRKGIQTNSHGKIASGKSLLLDLPKGENAVHLLTFHIETDTARYRQAMRQLIVQIAFDGRQTVSVPLSDFAAGGMGAPVTESWYLSSDGKGQVTSRWIMPYRKEARVSLLNLSPDEIEARVSARTDRWRWDDRSLYFHASWRQENGIRVSNNPDDNAECTDWNFATLKGRGVYKGDVLSLFNHTPAWYGEGDEKIWVDDDTFPSHFGTGTEDYYNSSWAPVIPFHTPFGGAPRADTESSAGYNTFFRTRNLDGIPFGKKLRFDIEMLSWVAGTVDYATTVYWYGDRDAVAEGTTPVKEACRPLLPQPADPAKFTLCDNALEFENLKPFEHSKNLRFGNQAMYAFPDHRWSHGEQMLCTGGKPGDFIVYRFDIPDNEPRHLILHGTKAPDFGKIGFEVNRKKLAVKVDAYSAEVIPTGPIYLGKFLSDKGKITLKITIEGTNPHTTGNRYLIGLDCIGITKTKKINLSATRR